MAYFLKKTNNKKGTYLQIYSSFYDPSDFVQYDDMAFNYIIADAKGRWKQ